MPAQIIPIPIKLFKDTKDDWKKNPHKRNEENNAIYEAIEQGKIALNNAVSDGFQFVAITSLVIGKSEAFIVYTLSKDE